jgi:glycosyltransferase involved in cell wall biosynthesis
VLHVLAQRPSRTGSGTTLDALVRAADARGFEQAALVGSPADDPSPAVGELPPERVHALLFHAGDRTGAVPFAVPGMSDVMPYVSSVWSELTPDEVDLYREAWRAKLSVVVEDFAPDLIHVHHTWIVASLIKDVAPAVPVVMHGHGTGLNQLAQCAHLAEEVRAGCARNEALCVLHDEHAARYATELGYDPGRIHVVGAGFREELFHDRDRGAGAGTLLYAGKLSRAKGVPWLLDAFDVLRAQRPRVRLELAGGGAGPEADAIRSRVAETEGCTALGALSPDDLAARMRTASIFVLPSLAEGLPLVLVEAAACGCRLVASDLPGTRALVNVLRERLHLVNDVPRSSTAHENRREQPFTQALVEGLTGALEAGEPKGEASLQAFQWSSVFVRVEAVWRRVRGSSGTT